eukprot:Amastigsp_a1609_259.p3 type:complete len:135 gc:universal Amastigsp_a1609_259:873-469(-)
MVKVNKSRVVEGTHSAHGQQRKHHAMLDLAAQRLPRQRHGGQHERKPEPMRPRRDEKSRADHLERLLGLPDFVRLDARVVAVLDRHRRGERLVAEISLGADDARVSLDEHERPENSRRKKPARRRREAKDPDRN